MKTNFEPSPYLHRMSNSSHRKMSSSLRLCFHQLCIVTGRSRNIDRSNRKCKLCDLDEIEDECHFLLICPYYKTLRGQFVSKYFYTRPSMFKLISLLNSKKLQTLNKTDIHCEKAIEKRKLIMN